MNTTIDLKTAKTIEAMNQKVNHMDTAVTDFFNKMSDVLERQLGDDEVYAAVIAPEIELTSKSTSTAAYGVSINGFQVCAGSLFSKQRRFYYGIL